MTDTILPHEMSDALDRAPAGVKVLSLDCFDTLLWRDCHAPINVFAGLTQVTPAQRAFAERQARKIMMTLHARSEVGLAQIYAEAMPNAPDEIRREAIAEELALEARTCFAFEPTVELMRAAKARGLRIVITSDTYCDAEQLRALIAAAAGEEVAGLIDRVFASSEHGIAKSQGLLSAAIKAMRCRSGEVFHIGDNHHADYESARALGIPALHLAQFPKEAVQRLRFERNCQQLIGEKRAGVSALQPHRALLSLEEPQLNDPANALGFSVLGPVFHAFDLWLRDEAEALSNARGGKVHWLFMLRDGHLPHCVHQTAGEAPSTARVEISRFVAIAASLTSRQAYTRHLASEYGLNPGTLARQMLYTEAEIERLSGDRNNTNSAEISRRLLADLRSGQRQKLTRKRARARAERLIEHIRASVDPKPGDTLMLVDLGYNGSAQDRVAPILSEAFGCHVCGRYLMLREMSASGLDKKGLIDARHYDAALLEALCGNVAVIEQLATCELGSVMDFTDNGQPIRRQSSVKGAQSEVRAAVQAGVARFTAAACRPPVVRNSDAHRQDGWREAAAGALTRFMYLPQPEELTVLKSFEHDVNLGSERMVALFDESHAREAMRRRGLFYMKGAQRMFLPAELAREDINTRLSLMTQKCLGLGFSYEDQSSQALSIPAIYLGAKSDAQTRIEAQPTHDGFYVARLPMVDHAKGIAVQLGSVFEWLELTSVTAAPVGALKGTSINDEPPTALSTHLDGMTMHTDGIVECTDPGAVLLVLPPDTGEGEATQMVEIVMRPLRRRPVTTSAERPGPSPFMYKENAA